MSDSTAFTPTRWPRFTEYIIEAGYIRPKPGATLSWYDPWEEFLENRQDTNRQNSAYHKLLKIIPNELNTLPRGHAKRLGFSHPGVLDRTIANNDLWTDSYVGVDEPAILKWCAKYGLFGLLPHRLLYAAFLSPEKTPVSLERRGGAWKWFKWGDLAWLVGRDWRPHMMIRSSGRAVSEPLNITWSRYFPSVPVEKCERFEYPSPDTEDFWRLYAEPVDEFLRTADELAQCLREMVEIPEPRSVRESQPSVSVEVSPHRGLNEFLEPVQPCLDLSGTKPQERYWSPSLLGLLALMIREDLARTGGRVVKCICGVTFIHPTKLYCSEIHQNTAEKRRQREKKKAEKTVKAKKNVK